MVAEQVHQPSYVHQSWIHPASGPARSSQAPSAYKPAQRESVAKIVPDPEITTFASIAVLTFRCPSGAGPDDDRSSERAARKVVLQELAEHGGTEVSTGPGFVVCRFATPSTSLRFAETTIRLLHCQRIRAAAGIHAGWIENRPGRAAGPGLTTAVQLTRAAGDGQVVVSESVRNLTIGSGYRMVVGASAEDRDPPYYVISSMDDPMAADRSPAPQGPGAIQPCLADAEAPRLSDREREVVELLADGLTNRAIASELRISAATVERHVTNILGKLGFRSRTQVAAWFTRHRAHHLSLAFVSP